LILNLGRVSFALVTDVLPEIVAWLQGLRMSEYAERFVEHRIDLSVLPDLTDEDLKELGVLLGDRRKLLRAIGELERNRTQSPTSAWAAERRQLTVMFCDLVGSTSLSAQLDPEDLRDIIGAYHRSCAATVERHGGFVAKYMGEGKRLGRWRAGHSDSERLPGSCPQCLPTVWAWCSHFRHTGSLLPALNAGVSIPVQTLAHRT